MTPVLPFNSWTITPIKLEGRERLQDLRRLDTHHRTTCPQREAEKAELRRKLGL